MPTNLPPPTSLLNGQVHAEESGAVMFDTEIQANLWSPSQIFTASWRNSFVENSHMNNS